ncbi:MAG: DUF177 domain-containing protein [Pseudomonadota bacterium]|nr:DUF177 domain-containing protein [Pseudomonadota bacterium]
MSDMIEFSVPIEVDEIPTKGLRRKISADEEARAALAARFDLLALESLDAAFELKPLAGGPMIRVEGRVTADVTQSCVVSGAPIRSNLDQVVSVFFAPPGMIEENQEFTLADADPPEPIEAGVIDLGELAAQQLILALDPYPRAEGAQLDALIDTLPDGRKTGVQAGPVDKSADNPFAKLAALKDKSAPGEDESR